MTYYWKFAVVYLATILACGIVNIYLDLDKGYAALISTVLVFLAIPVWAFWAGKGQSS